jgi:hypothetical protein
MTEFVKLAGHLLPVPPQPHARLRHHLSADDFQRVMGAEYSAHTYRILSVFIPELPRQIPEYVWEGMPDQETLDRYRAGDEIVYDDEAAGKSPDFDQIANAFEVAVKVNGGDRVGKLLGLISTVSRLGDTGRAAMETQQTTPLSPVMPGVNGA